MTGMRKQLKKAGYEHFMMKEIHEQPRAVKDTLNSVLKDGKIDLTDIGLAEEDIRRTSQIYIVACGSAYHVGMVAQYVIEDLVKIPVRVELASEFRYRKPILDPNGLVIIISQSGETADSLAALRETKAQGIRTLGIVNVVGSSIAREADKVFYTLAGPEISVATTKAYSTQLMASYILTIEFAKVKIQSLKSSMKIILPNYRQSRRRSKRLLKIKKESSGFAAKQANAKDAFCRTWN